MYTLKEIVDSTETTPEIIVFIDEYQMLTEDERAKIMAYAIKTICEHNDLILWILRRRL